MAEESAADHKKIVTESTAHAALEDLCAGLRNSGNAHRYFDALALSARYELGLPLILPTETAEFLPDVRTAYESRLIEACREVGSRLLAAGDLRGAFHYLNTIGELDPIRRAIESFQPPADWNDDDSANAKVDAVLELALGHGVYPQKGIEIILQRSGTCQGVTACQSVMATEPRVEVREACAKLVVRRLHAELVERVQAEIRHVEGPAASIDGPMATWFESRSWLFENDNYHIDTSHLNSAVRFARILPNCEEVYLTLELCEYGRRLSERYAFGEAAPFENIYLDTLIFLRAVVGIEVETTVEHFRVKAEKANIAEGETYPAEVFVNLLVQLGRLDEAIVFAANSLNSQNGGVGLSCPSVNELCRRSGRFDLLERYAIERNDAVSVLAARLTSQPDLAKGMPSD